MNSQKRISRGKKMRRLKAKNFINEVQSVALVENFYKVFQWMNRHPFKIFLAKYFGWLGFRIDFDEIIKKISK